MAEENLVLIEKKEGVAWITMNRPHSLNALTLDMMGQLKEAIVSADQDPQVGVIVITGTGKSWCTGLDLKSLGKIEIIGGAVGAEIDSCGRGIINAVQTASKVVIAMVNGFVFTGGLELLLSTDIIVAAENAVFGDTHCKYGLRPSWGMSQRLARLVGLNRAKYMSFTAKTITAQQAMDFGLVSTVVPADKLREEVESLCTVILKNSQEALAANKKLYNLGWQTNLQEGLEEIEGKMTFEINDTDERIAGFR